MWIQNKYERELTRFSGSKTIKKEDKDLIIRMVNKLLATKINESRAEKYYTYARLILERGWLPGYCDIDEAKLYKFLSIIQHNPHFSPETKRDYKIVVKRAMETAGNPLTSQIKTTSPPRYLPRYFLTVHDILQMLRCPWPHLRDKAMVAVLYESNCRPHEFFQLKRSDVRFERVPVTISGKSSSLEVAYLNIAQDCKTGARSPPVLFSVPWLKAWLLSAPNLEYLWTSIRGNSWGDQIQYMAARKAVKSIAKSAKIENASKITLYSFRHGRNTEVSQTLTAAQQCEYAGWKQGSDMPRIYNHLSGVSMLAPLISPYGVRIDKSHDERDAWLEIMKSGDKIFSGK